jgi:predicted peptidase
MTSKSPLIGLLLIVCAWLAIPAIVLAQNGRIEQGQIFSSALTNNVLGDSGTRPFSVYLPGSYDITQKRYPVVYALHGYGQSHNDTATFLQPSLDSMTAARTIGEMIVVFASGTNRLWGCQYVSSPVIGDYETYLAKDLVAYIDAHYRTLATRDSRGITGVSMGGWGAMHLALKFPEVFGVVVPNPGYYDLLGDVEQSFFRLSSPGPTNLMQFDSLSFPQNWVQSLLAGLLPDLQRPELYTDYPYELANGQLVAVDTAMQRLRDGDVQHGDLGRYLLQPVRLNAIKIVHGTNDPVVPVLEARAFTNALTTTGVQFTYEEHSGGHTYVPELSLPFLATNLGAEAYVGPLIIQQPQSCTNAAGTTATFSVTATGAPPLAYQWQHDLEDLVFRDLPGRTEPSLVLTNVTFGDTVSYRVVVSNAYGAATSAVAHLTILLVPPKISPTMTLQHQAVHIDTKASFAVTASGTAPLAYQWQLDGEELAGQTNRTLTFSEVQPADEGDYSVVVSNPAGAVTSAPVRLWVVPRLSALVWSNFTNSLGRLPYFYLLPTNYDAARTYPLSFVFGGGGDENDTRNADYPAVEALSSYRQQERDPVIQLWPQKRAGDKNWTDSYLRQASALLDQFMTQYNVNTKRVYVSGFSEGVHAAWDMIGMRPGFFAGAALAAGWQGSSPASSLKGVPVWAWCAQDDTGQLDNTRQTMHSLRLAGSTVRYTEYRTGAYSDNTGAYYIPHVAGILMGWATPVIDDWLLAQHGGVPSLAEPLLTITHPPARPAWPTGATNLSLAGSALALDQDVTSVAWENTANKLTGVAAGSNAWTITGLPLTANATNVIVVTGTTTSWAPACGGNTTFNDTLMVVSSPIQATLELQGTSALLNWTGGGPPYRIQHATDLIAADWMDVLSNATPPVILSPTNPVGFYRVVGQ